MLAWVGTLASGVMVASIWIGSIRPWCIGVAFAPLFVTWARATSVRQVLAHGLVAQLITSAIAFFWVREAVQTHFGAGPALGTALWLAAACLANLHVAGIGALWKLLCRRLQLRSGASLLLLPSLWLSVWAVTPQLIPFDYGYPWLWSGLPILQLADVVGFSGLAGCTLLLSALAALAWLSRERGLQISAGYLGLALALFGGLNAVGAVRAREWSSTDRVLRVKAIQHNPARAATPERDPDPELRGLRAVSGVRDLVHRSIDGASPADLWIWPESALPLWLGHPEHRAPLEGLKHAIRVAGTPLLTGIGTGGERATYYNSLIALDSTGALAGTYRKRILFPFERPPVASAVRSLPEASNPYRAAPDHVEPPILELNGLRLGVTICFEGLFVDLFRSSAARGAQIFVNVSSDQVFGRFAEPYQHMYMTLARAIEFRRPLVRVASSGITTAILADGRILLQSPLGTDWSGTFDIPYRADAPATPFEEYGALLPGLWLLVALMTCALGARHRERLPMRSSPPEPVIEASPCCRADPARPAPLRGGA